jgi:hypothetical protein
VSERSFIILWVILLSLVLVIPPALGLPTLPEDLTRNTVRLALIYYVLAINLLLWIGPNDWSPAGKLVAWTRWCWTLACFTYLVHLAVAFHYYHHWSHADAMRHVEEIGGFGWGIYLSYLFTLLWTGDVTFWWMQPARYAGRARWIDLALHAFMFFIIFNGAVVFAEGPIRWAGLLITAELAALLALRSIRAKRQPSD